MKSLDDNQYKWVIHNPQGILIALVLFIFLQLIALDDGNFKFLEMNNLFNRKIIQYFIFSLGRE